MKILDKYIELIEKGYCDDCNELNCIGNYPHKKIAQEIKDLQQENQQLKKQKADVVEYIKKNLIVGSILDGKKTYVLNNYTFDYEDLLRMLGEIDDK